MRSPARLAGEARDPRQPPDVPARLPQLRRPRVARRQPHRRHRDRERRARAGTRSAARATRRSSISRGPTRRTRTSAGWARSRWTATATSPSATPSRARPCTRRSPSRAGSRAIRSGRWAPRTSGSPAAAARSASSSRWGDYSTMSIDPVDDCTFWYTQEYYARHGELRLQDARSAPSASRAARPALRDARRHGDGRLRPDRGSDGDGDASVGRAGASTTTTDAAGHYQFLTLPAGTYDVTASKYGYLPSTAAGVVVSAGANHRAGLHARSRAPTVLVIGTVKDGSGQGWPLYAQARRLGAHRLPGRDAASPIR